METQIETKEDEVTFPLSPEEIKKMDQAEEEIYRKESRIAFKLFNLPRLDEVDDVWLVPDRVKMKKKKQVKKPFQCQHFRFTTGAMCNHFECA
jgi:hypothetical protein